MASVTTLACKTNYENEDSLKERSEASNGLELVEYKGFFFTPNILEGVKAMHKDFQPRADDVYLCSSVKTGTTWVKAILASIMKEGNTSILEERNPHDLIPNLEMQCYGPTAMRNASHILEEMPSPRLLHTHVPYSVLPHGVISCRIIYITRNPKDTFVSYCKFVERIFASNNIAQSDNNAKEQVFEDFCMGFCPYGPFLDHVLSYWNPSKDKDNSNILFLTYEDLKEDTSSCIRRIADFMGRSSSLTDKDIDRISYRCSFQFLSNLDVNRNENMQEISNMVIQNNSFFRKGNVGDWMSYFTPAMNSSLDFIIERKLEGSGLWFKYELEDN